MHGVSFTILKRSNLLSWSPVIIEKPKTMSVEYFPRKWIFSINSCANGTWRGTERKWCWCFGLKAGEVLYRPWGPLKWLQSPVIYRLYMSMTYKALDKKIPSWPAAEAGFLIFVIIPMTSSLALRNLSRRELLCICCRAISVTNLYRKR